MGRTIMGAVVSLDGFIAYDDSVGPLFDWYGNVEWKFSEDQEHPSRTTQASKDFMLALDPRIGAAPPVRPDRRVGRRPCRGRPAFVVTHKPPTNWKHAGAAPFTFVTDGVEAAIAQAREFAGTDREVDVAAGEIGG
jgi:dihydrofolate reductase